MGGLLEDGRSARGGCFFFPFPVGEGEGGELIEMETGSGELDVCAWKGSKVAMKIER